MRVDTISNLIMGHLYSTTASALTGMEYRERDLAICEQVLFNSVIARNASLLEGPYKRHYPSSTKASTSNCGVQMWNAGEDRQVYQCEGEDWDEIGEILSNVLKKASHY